MQATDDGKHDDLGFRHHGGPPRRVVSLVPSTTETVALSAPELLVAATDYCVHPADLDVPRVGGSKYPNLDRVLQARPDLVLANAEENRKSDVDALREAGVAVWVSFPRDVDEACRSARRMLVEALGVEEPAWISAAQQAWRQPAAPALRAVIPIWRKPWMVVGSGTFAGDMLRRLGVVNVFDDAQATYPKTDMSAMLARDPDLAVLPDEPYEFTADDGPEAFAGLPCALVSGRMLTWHGPSLAHARSRLEEQLRRRR